jgi:hypothetical protein
VWFTRWATGMFALLFAKVPIAIMLALAVSLFADSRYAGTTQSFVNAAAGLVLGFGALLAPLLGFGLFSFMSSVVARPAMGGAAAQRAATSTYYGQQMTRTAVTACGPSVARHLRPEPSAAERQAGAQVTTTQSGAGSVRTDAVSPPARLLIRRFKSTAAAQLVTATVRPSTVRLRRRLGGRGGCCRSGGASGGNGAAGAASMAGPTAPIATAAVAAGAAAKAGGSKAKGATARIANTSGSPDPGPSGHGSITPPSARSTD